MWYDSPKRAVCGECGLRKDCVVARHFGGGNYRRSGRLYPKNICQSCALHLLTSGDPKPMWMMVHLWDQYSLRDALDRFVVLDNKEEQK